MNRDGELAYSKFREGVLGGLDLKHVGEGLSGSALAILDFVVLIYCLHRIEVPKNGLDVNIIFFFFQRFQRSDDEVFPKHGFCHQRRSGVQPAVF